MKAMIYILISVFITGCYTYNNDNIIRTEQIQQIYWKCYDDPDNISSNKILWQQKYDDDIIEKGIRLYVEQN